MVLGVIAIGSSAGALARYGISRGLAVTPGHFPWATFVANTTGSLVLGALLTLIIERWPPSRYLRPLLAIGFVGSYTTFSTFMVETGLLVRDHETPTASMYVVASLMLGLAAAYAGMVSVRSWPRTRERR